MFRFHSERRVSNFECGVYFAPAVWEAKFRIHREISKSKIYYRIEHVYLGPHLGGAIDVIKRFIERKN